MKRFMLIAIGVLVAYEVEQFVEFEVRHKREAARRKARPTCSVHALWRV
jgi:hypothetical protein